ncbi:MAG: protease complex subunit PrcB family protein [Bacillota bacterium]|nr:protease complex subunit PrcB family protein [Bacillota bacterium]
MRTRVLIVAVILATLVTGIAWRVTAQAADPDVITEGDIQLTDEMRQWVEARKTIPGVHIGVFDGFRLVLISAGEKPTAGYAVTVENVTRNGQAWIIRARNTGPAGGMVAQVITHPYALVGVKGDVELPIRVQDPASGRDWPAAVRQTTPI